MKYILKYIAIMLLTLLITSDVAQAASEGREMKMVYVSTFEELDEAIRNGNNLRFVLQQDIETDRPLRFTEKTELNNRSEFYPSRVFCLDLNGYTFTVNETVLNEYDLTICDGGKTGVLLTHSIINSGRFTLESGRIERIQNDDEYRALLVSCGKMSELHLKGGTISNKCYGANTVAQFDGNAYICGANIISESGMAAYYFSADWITVGVIDPDTGAPGYEFIATKPYLRIDSGKIISAGEVALELSCNPDLEAECVINGGIIEAKNSRGIKCTHLFPTILGGTVRGTYGAIIPYVSSEKAGYYNASGKFIEIDSSVKEISLPFGDVYGNDWYFESAKQMHDLGIMTGYPDGSFQPQNKLSRAELVTMLYRYDGAVEQAAPPFTDVPANSYYAEAAAWAYENGIVTGTSATTFSPDDPITREQLVTMLYRYAVYKGQTPAASADATQFTDYAAVSDYAKPAVNWAVSEGLLTGKGNQKLEPQSTATRAETAALIARYIDGAK